MGTPSGIERVVFEGSEITWAGEWPWTNGFCFGTNNGSIWFTAINMIDTLPLSIAPSKEAINGVAFVGDPGNYLMAVSTRAEVVFNPFTKQEYVYEGGAHTVIATLRNGFLAPLGPDGILSFNYTARKIKAKDVDLYFYKIASLGGSRDGSEAFACAGRHSGLLHFTLDRNGRPNSISTYHMKNHSIVDVCSLGTNPWLSALAVMTSDRRIHLSHNFASDHSVTTLDFSEMDGVAYSLLSAKGHIFVLTSMGIFVFPGLGSKFAIEGPTRCIFLPCDAVSFHLVYQRYLFIILHDETWLLEIEKLINQPYQLFTPAIRTSKWEEGPVYEAEICES